MTTTYPGVYMQEVASGVKPITGAGTSTAAFFGVSERGPMGEVTPIFNFTEFGNLYGGFLANHFLAHSVFQFFANGGAKCYVGRVARNPETASVTVLDRTATQDSLTFSASSPGVWGNDYQVTVESTNDNTFDVTVFRFGFDDPAPVEVESFTGLDLLLGSPNHVETVIHHGEVVA